MGIGGLVMMCRYRLGGDGSGDYLDSRVAK
jgi:hypothetical protein